MEFETIEDAAAEAKRLGKNLICLVEGQLVKVYMLGSWRDATGSDREVYNATEGTL